VADWRRQGARAGAVADWRRQGARADEGALGADYIELRTMRALDQVAGHSSPPRRARRRRAVARWIDPSVFFLDDDEDDDDVGPDGEGTNPEKVRVPSSRCGTRCAVDGCPVGQVAATECARATAGGDDARCAPCNECKEAFVSVILSAIVDALNTASADAVLTVPVWLWSDDERSEATTASVTPHVGRLASAYKRAILTPSSHRVPRRIVVAFRHGGNGERLHSERSSSSRSDRVEERSDHVEERSDNSERSDEDEAEGADERNDDEEERSDNDSDEDSSQDDPWAYIAVWAEGVAIPAASLAEWFHILLLSFRHVVFDVRDVLRSSDARAFYTREASHVAYVDDTQLVDVDRRRTHELFEKDATTRAALQVPFVFFDQFVHVVRAHHLRVVQGVEVPEVCLAWTA